MLVQKINVNENMNKKLRNCKKRLVKVTRYGIIHFSGDTTCFQFIHNSVKIIKPRGRKHKMKKKLALVLAATMAMSVFAMGCGSQESTDETTTAAKTTAATDANTEADTTADAEDTTAAPEETTEAPAAEGTTYDAQTLELTTFWESGYSSSYALADGQTLTVKMKSTTPETATNNWDNWVLACTNIARDDATYAGTAESIVLRADNFGWGTDYVATNFAITLNGGEMDWTNWLADSKAGMDVDLTVTRTGADFELHAVSVSGSNTYDYTVKWTATTTLADTMYIFFTGENVTIDITSAEVK